MNKNNLSKKENDLALEMRNNLRRRKKQLMERKNKDIESSKEKYKKKFKKITELNKGSLNNVYYA